LVERARFELDRMDDRYEMDAFDFAVLRVNASVWTSLVSSIVRMV
jgi:hypothetical protein